MIRHIASGLIFATTALGDVSLPALMRDGMVLQRGGEARVCGFAAPGEEVFVRPSWAKEDASARADSVGRWSASVSTRDVGPGPHSIDVRSTNRITIRDVLVGEVWIASGQSNMEWVLRDSDGGVEAAQHARDPMLRFFQVENTMSLHEHLDSRGSWKRCTPDDASGFSAVAYHFARELRERIGSGDVPVAIIQADWGGTPIESWMSPATLRSLGEFGEALDTQEVLRDPLRRGNIEGDVHERWFSLFGNIEPRPQQGWTTRGFDDSGWKTLSLPATWSGELGSFDGVAYFRRAVTIPAADAGKAATLSLGPIDDRDETRVNGVLVGATRDDGLWNKPRTYEIPEGVLVEGENVIAITALDTAGPGGINGEPAQLSLRVHGGSEHALAGDWKYALGVSASRLPPLPQSVGVTPQSPGVLWNGMIAPLTGMSARGVIWYQGESNVGRAEQYARLLPAMVGSWREAFSTPELAFYSVQIAPYGYRNDKGECAMLREAQRSLLSLPGTGLVCTLDVGDPGDIHPRAKREVGERLANMALARNYGAYGLVDSGPEFAGAEAHGSEMRVRFNTGGPEERLELRDPAPDVFWIAGADGVFFPARARIEQDRLGEALVLSCERVARPLHARYAWDDAPRAALFNTAGLPASPFRTDRWSDGHWTLDDDAFVALWRSNDPELRPIFNGSTLDGWVNVNCGPSTWTVRTNEPGGPLIHCTGLPTGVLRTDRMYQNFVLEMEYRHLEPGGNAGLFVWSDALTARGVPFTRSVEVQVMDGQEGEWFTSDGDVFPIHGAVMTPVNGRGRGSRAYPTQRRSNPSPRWNHYRVECVDGAIIVSLNGAPVTSGHSISPRKGYICLESEGASVQFRNIRVKELPSAEIPPEQVALGDEGFVSLLGDRTLSQWDVSPDNAQHWKMDDWVLEYDGKGDHLRTRERFKDLELIADWRFIAPAQTIERPVFNADGSQATDEAGKPVTQAVRDAGDSGIYLRGDERSQVNIWCWPVGSGELWSIRNDRSVAPEVRAGATPRTKADAPIGQWNRFRIRLIGERVTVDLNGERVIDNALMPGIAKEGPILLQHHGDPIQFANIYVKHLQ